MDLLIQFFDSNFFVAFVTLLVGAVAYILYRIQRRDRKREIANIILLEIQSAERKLKLIRKSLNQDPPTLPNDLRLLPVESWSANNYLFIRDFDRDAWDAIADFYDKCQLIDETIKFNNASFWNDIEQIRSNKQRLLADFANNAARKLKGAVDNVEDGDAQVLEEFNDLTEKFDRIYMSRQSRFGYAPNKPVNDAKAYVDQVDRRISQSSVGIKLKKLAHIKPKI
ncbi:MAG TPA: hypothetical protein VLA88_05975 [Candidatus Saccharimonadales bacterium]|nr:hypothetical protein [Candidatus Saccharimonadales bacterium]